MINNARTMMGLKVVSLWWFGFEPWGLFLDGPRTFLHQAGKPLQNLNTDYYYRALLFVYANNN